MSIEQVPVIICCSLALGIWSYGFIKYWIPWFISKPTGETDWITRIVCAGMLIAIIIFILNNI